MTVEELISKLIIMPPNAYVIFEARSLSRDFSKATDHEDPFCGDVDEVKKEMRIRWKCVLSGDLL